MASMIRVMLDTNVLFSAMYMLAGKPFEAFCKSSKMPYRLVLCDQIIDELRRNINRKFSQKMSALKGLNPKIMTAAQFISIINS